MVIKVDGVERATHPIRPRPQKGRSTYMEERWPGSPKPLQHLHLFSPGRPRLDRDRTGLVQVIHLVPCAWKRIIELRRTGGLSRRAAEPIP